MENRIFLKILSEIIVHKSNMTKALNVEFILQNLKQKKDIKDAMLSQVSFDLEKWFYQQVKLTVDYYLRETRPQLKSAVAVLKWGLQNMKKNRLHFFLDWLYDLVYSYRATRKCREEKKMKRRQVFSNILSGFLGQVITLLLGIILPRLFIMTFGSEINGLLSSVNQVYVYIGLLEAGVGTATLQALYKPIASQEKDSIIPYIGN